ncbi:hypothetical protein C9374_007524 [Naegleria lovaniensis]|uniref:Uncharacterized protein n=1 Tax=Naegleria lovaniensis TaxID=51637 RepID=A0AA88GM96_NAELO|nr:uncharacterized protein C9374_007524 [Naegleria lovaniensis]KAG2379385.1 hypothetical protein C9374_007524 [Naegleria lovaniensis]
MSKNKRLIEEYNRQVLELSKQFNGSQKKKIVPIEDISSDSDGNDDDEWEDIEDDEYGEDFDPNVHALEDDSESEDEGTDSEDEGTSLPSEEASKKVQQALSENDAFKTLFQSRVQVTENCYTETSGRDSVSSKYVVQMKFGEGTEKPSLELHFKGDIQYDPMEEGSTGSYRATVTVLDQSSSKTELLSGELFKNMEEVDYCLGYGGVKLTSNVKKLMTVLNIDSKMLLSLMDMICTAIPVFPQGDMEFVSEIMQLVYDYVGESIQCQQKKKKQ